MQSSSTPDSLPRHGPCLLKICFTAILLLLVWNQVRVLTHFAIVYADKDQVLMWTAAHELLQGRIHEPRFYGQDYNSMIEGYLASPLVASGVPYHVAVPVVTSVLCLAPFVVLGFCCWRSGQPLAALLALAMPLMLPIEYTMITSMPRGFVTGNCFITVVACLILFPMSCRSFFLSGLLLVLGVSLNPTVLIMATPVALVLVLRHWRSRRFYLWVGAGGLLAAAGHYASVAFYDIYPSHRVYAVLFDEVLSVEALRRGWRNLDGHLGVLTPVWANQVWILGLVFSAILIGLWRCHARLPFISLLLGLVVVGLSFSIERVHVGSDSVYWHLARFYLSVPLVMVLGFAWFEQAAGKRLGFGHRNLVSVGLTLLVVTVFVGHGLVYEKVVQKHVGIINPAGVQAVPVQLIYERCEALGELASQTGHKLVVFGFVHKTVAYACEPILRERVKTLMVRDFVAERRTWRLYEERDGPTRDVLFYNFSEEQIKRGQSLGLIPEPAVLIGNIRTVPGRVPDGVDLFDVLSQMDIPGAQDLEARVGFLGVE